MLMLKIMNLMNVIHFVSSFDSSKQEKHLGAPTNPIKSIWSLNEIDDTFVFLPWNKLDGTDKGGLFVPSQLGIILTFYTDYFYSGASPPVIHTECGIGKRRHIRIQRTMHVHAQNKTPRQQRQHHILLATTQTSSVFTYRTNSVMRFCNFQFCFCVSSDAKFPTRNPLS